MNKLEQIRQQPKRIEEHDVIDILDMCYVDNKETRELLIKYIDQCNEEADDIIEKAKGTMDLNYVVKVLTNRERIKALIKIATLYSKTKNYRDQAWEAFEEVREAAIQEESTKDLENQINKLMDGMEYN